MGLDCGGDGWNIVVCKRSSVITAGAWVAFIHLGALDRTLGIDRLRRHLAETSPRPSMDDKFDRLRRAPGIQQWLGCGGSSRHHYHRSIFFFQPPHRCPRSLLCAHICVRAETTGRGFGGSDRSIQDTKASPNTSISLLLCRSKHNGVSARIVCVCFDRPPHKGRRAKHAPRPSVFIHSNPVLLSADFQ